MIEVLAVLAILGLGFALLASRGPARVPGLELRGAAGEVARTLRAARTLAIARNQTVIVGRDVAWPLAAPGIRMVPPAGGIRFDALGGSFGGRVTLSAGTARRDVVVHWLSGRVETSDVR